MLRPVLLEWVREMGAWELEIGVQTGDKLGEEVGPGDVFQAHGCSRGHDTGKWEDSLKRRGGELREQRLLE